LASAVFTGLETFKSCWLVQIQVGDTFFVSRPLDNLPRRVRASGPLPVGRRHRSNADRCIEEFLDRHLEAICKGVPRSHERVKGEEERHMHGLTGRARPPNSERDSSFTRIAGENG